MNMREKIARAIDSRPFSENWQESFLFEAWRGEAEAKAYRSADAVLDALMEPTGQMLASGAAVHSANWPGRIIGAVPLRAAYRGMIQAAKEGK